MSKGRVILQDEQFELTLLRLCHQILENYGQPAEFYMIGIQEKGVILADRLYQKIIDVDPKAKVLLGKLDITFYRDDFGRRGFPLKANTTEIDFLIEDKPVILIDDVLYSGRTIQAGLMALQDFGRPSKVELVTMVDRRFNRHLPIQADYVGVSVDAIDEAYVRVQWQEVEGQDRVLLFSSKTKSDS